MVNWVNVSKFYVPVYSNNFKNWNFHQQRW